VVQRRVQCLNPLSRSLSAVVVGTAMFPVVTNLAIVGLGCSGCSDVS